MVKKKQSKKSPPASATGSYRYDKELGEVVLVSDGVPKVASKGRAAAPDLGPCGRERGACGGGRCG